VEKEVCLQTLYLTFQNVLVLHRVLHEKLTVTLHLNIYSMQPSIYISGTPKIVSRSLRRISDERSQLFLCSLFLKTSKMY